MALPVAVSTVPLNHDLQQTNFQEPSSRLVSAEGTVRPIKTSADIPRSGRSACDLGKPFTHGASLSFHDPPRHYTLAKKIDTSKSNSGAHTAVFVLRSSRIIEEDNSDEEFEPEDRKDDDKPACSFPYEDSKINELVSVMASLNLGIDLNVARTTVTPTRVRARLSLFVPPRTPVSSPVTASHSVVAHTTPMEVDEDAVHQKVANNDATYPQKCSDSAMPMDGVVFYPEVKDAEMKDVLATNRKLTRTIPIYYS